MPHDTSQLNLLLYDSFFSLSDSKFTQQELPACKPILTPKWVSFTVCCYASNFTCIFGKLAACVGKVLIEEALSFLQVILTFLVVGIAFVPIGITSLLASRDVCLVLGYNFVIIFSVSK